MMLNTYPIHTSVVRNAEKSKPSHSFIEKKLKLHAAGHGIVIVSNAGALRVLDMVSPIEISVMLDYAHGGLKILLPQKQMINAVGLRVNMTYQSNRLKKCAVRNMENVLSASEAQLAYLWIIAMRLAGFGRFYAKHAILSLAGMSARPIQFFASKIISRLTRRYNQPCHADVLLEIANMEQMP